ncbi:MAG: hypothetical protein AB1689_01780 [Thermodesulfobacteriota bacterium]
MRKVVIGVATFALGMALAVTPAFPQTAAQQTGTVVAVEEDVVRIKGADGKEYEVDATVVAAEDLKTGDTVEYAIVSEKPVRVKKKK